MRDGTPPTLQASSWALGSCLDSCAPPADPPPLLLLLLLLSPPLLLLQTALSLKSPVRMAADPTAAAPETLSQEVS